ncbi:acetate--CoA ligase [Candidatus Dependentiae bacterium]|nr:acetate--CoA ligase [Candidatus Dependentiae bacterium]
MLEKFWEQEAKKLKWFKGWNKVLDWNKPYAKWFVGGKINASYQCLDVHVENGLENKIAIYWENELGEKKEISYKKLYDDVNKFASGLKKLGVKKGDVVILYMPMIPQAVISMLACARIGAIHSVVFSAFSYKSLKDRINDTKAKFLITADYALRRGKNIDLKFVVDLAVHNTTVEKVVLVKRTDKGITLNEGIDVLYQDLIDNAQDFCEPEKLDSNHPLFVLYTSGTTGKPKGIVHSTGGYLTYVNSTFKQAFGDLKNEIYWCTGDIGWITGHSYIVYAPLMQGTSIVIYEGTPDYPDTSIWWKIIQDYKVSVFYTSPTAIRMLRKISSDTIKDFDLSSLKVLGSVGEVINPDVWEWFFEHVGNKKCPIIDTWWQTETGGFMLAPKISYKISELKPGSATYPLDQIDADIVDENGKSVALGEKGFLVIKKPWPGLTQGIWGDKKRYEEIYWSRFKNYYPGDYAIKDTQGYFWLLGRSDETLNISGHRIGTSEIENAAILNSNVAEAAVAAIPDKIRGQNFCLFVVLNNKSEDEELLKKEIIQTLKTEIGSLAKPAKIYFVESLPKTRSGKIMRRLLSALLRKETIGDVSTLQDANSVEKIKLVIR